MIFFDVDHYGRYRDHFGDGFRAVKIDGQHKNFAAQFDSSWLLEHKTSR